MTDAVPASAVGHLVDLARVAASSGTTVPTLVRAVALRAPAPARPAFARGLVALDRGRPLDEVLHELGAELGDDGRLLCDALGRSARTGAPVEPMLVEVARTVHDRRHRAAQAAARRLPVTMLLPLVLCVLPAAVILAVVPVIWVSLDALAP